jgi:putative cardiolipin synthase
MRMNRRMHNKSYIVDGAVAIIGGRNIGDEYFQVGDENYFLDLDVLSVGNVVAETAEVFDRYWNSASVFGVEQIIRGKGDLSAFLTQAAATVNWRCSWKPARCAFAMAPYSRNSPR